MKKADVKIGSVYLCNHTSGKVPVKILAEKEPVNRKYHKARTHWRAINLKTGREIEIKSAAKLLREITEGVDFANALGN